MAYVYSRAPVISCIISVHTRPDYEDGIFTLNTMILIYLASDCMVVVYVEDLRSFEFNDSNIIFTESHS